MLNWLFFFVGLQLWYIKCFLATKSVYEIMVSYISAFTKASSSAHCTGLGMPHTHTHGQRVLVWRPWVQRSTGGLLVGERIKKNPLTDKKSLLLQEEQVVLDVSPLIHTVTSAAVPERHKIITAGFDISVAFWVFFSDWCLPVWETSWGMLAKYDQQLLCLSQTPSRSHWRI